MLQTKEERIKNGFVCPASERGRLISEHIPLIKFHASRLATQLSATFEVDQLVDAGVIALIEAATSYEPGCGLEFKTYADQRIQAAMTLRLRELNPTLCGIRPRTRKFRKTSQKLRPKLRREARDLELCLAMGIDPEELASFELIAQLSGLGIGSFSEVPRTCDQVEAHERLFRYSPERDSDQSCCLLKRAELLKILTDAVDDLPPDERLVVSLHYFEALTMKEIATVLRLGEWRVSQLHTKAALRLRTRLRSQQYRTPGVD